MEFGLLTFKTFYMLKKLFKNLKERANKQKSMIGLL